MKKPRNMKTGAFTVAMLLLATTAVAIVNADFMPHPGFDLIRQPAGGMHGDQSTGDPPTPPGPCLTLSPAFADLGMYSIHSPQWITYSFDVTNTGVGTLTWSIDGFPWWVAYITINGQQGYGGSCTAGQTKTFVIHMYTGGLEDPYVTDNPYTGMINLSSNVNSATATAVIDMVDPQYPGHQQWEFLFPSNLEPGDLLFMDAKPWVVNAFNVPSSDGEHNDHVIIYWKYQFGMHWFIEAINYTIYAENLANYTFPHRSGVLKTPWWVFCFWAKNFYIGQVNGATGQQKQKAWEHAKNLSTLPYIKYQSGYPDYDPYEPICNPNITDPSNPYYNAYLWLDDPGINSYFCAELVWSCYLHATPPINIDHFPEYYTTWYYGSGLHHRGVSVGPNSLLDSQNITFSAYIPQS